MDCLHMWVGGGFVCSTKAATEIIKTGHREKKMYIEIK